MNNIILFLIIFYNCSILFYKIIIIFYLKYYKIESRQSLEVLPPASNFDRTLLLPSAFLRSFSSPSSADIWLLLAVITRPPSHLCDCLPHETYRSQQGFFAVHCVRHVSPGIASFHHVSLWLPLFYLLKWFTFLLIDLFLFGLSLFVLD